MPATEITSIDLEKRIVSTEFDEIQFDYIRFPATTHSYLDYNYNEEKFTQAYLSKKYINFVPSICIYCGAPMEENSLVCPKCGKKYPFICPKCGSKMTLAKVCVKCGFKL